MPEVIVEPRRKRGKYKRYPKGQGPNPRCPPNTAPPDQNVLQPLEVIGIYESAPGEPAKHVPKTIQKY